MDDQNVDTLNVCSTWTHPIVDQSNFGDRGQQIYGHTNEESATLSAPLFTEAYIMLEQGESAKYYR
eukprot:scaffold45125_cov60-Attheya_sp.AAC.5